MAKIKIVAAATLGALLALFAIQNMAPVQLTVLLWSFESRRVVVIGVSFLIGFVIGWTAHTLKRRASANSPGRATPTDSIEE